MYLIKQRIRAHLFVNFALYKYLIIIIIILFNVMLQHGYNTKDLILSSIISIPKDVKSSLSSRITGAFHYLMPWVKYLITQYYLYIKCLQTLDMQFGLNQKHSTVMCILYIVIWVMVVMFTAVNW